MDISEEQNLMCFFDLRFRTLKKTEEHTSTLINVFNDGLMK